MSVMNIINIIITSRKKTNTLNNLCIQYNDVYSYDQNYPDQNVIEVKTVLPNEVNSLLEANTGLDYDLDNNKLLVVSVKTDERWYDRNVNQLSTVQDFVSQGVAYDSINGRYFVLMTDHINIFDYQRNSIGSYLFPEAQPNPGSLFYDIYNNLFYTTYDNSNKVSIWDINEGVLSLQSEIIIAVNEGVSLDYFDNNIWIQQLNKKTKINHNGEVIKTIDFTGSGQTGWILEGLICDPTDGSLWFNSDEYYHGGIDGGNRLWHIDPNMEYGRYLKIPNQIRWSWGILDNLSVSGFFLKEKLSKIDNNSQATWISPIIDFESYILHKNIENYLIRGVDFHFRSSNTPPSTNVNNQFHYNYYMPNQEIEGWGATIPSAWSSDLSIQGRYMQIKIVL